MGRMGGLWDRAPRLAALTLAFAVASLGLPGLGNFVGEFLVLVGSYQIAPIVTSVAALGIIGAAIYSLWLIHRVFYGEAGSTAPIADLAPRSVAALGACLALLLWIGLYSQALMPAIGSALEPFQSDTTATERGSVATVMAR
jgi:NADH-quinone oxidoreductase subunit M